MVFFRRFNRIHGEQIISKANCFLCINNILFVKQKAFLSRHKHFDSHKNYDEKNITLYFKFNCFLIKSIKLKYTYLAIISSLLLYSKKVYFINILLIRLIIHGVRFLHNKIFL